MSLISPFHSTVPLLFTAALAAFLGDYFIHKASEHWRKEINKEDPYLTKEDKKSQTRLSSVARQVGMVERALYVIAWFMGKPEFIGVWLAFKVAIEWRAWNPDIMYGDSKEEHRHYLIVQRARFNNFILGNALSLFSTFVIVILTEAFFS